MPLKRLGKPPFLRPGDVVDDDLVEIVGDPYIRHSERWHRDRGYVPVKLLRTGEVYTLPLNATSWDRCLDAWGDQEGLWVGRRAKLKLMDQLVRGEQRKVMYVVPLVEQLPTPVSPPRHTLEEDIAAWVAKLPPEAKKALLEALKEEASTG